MPDGYRTVVPVMKTSDFYYDLPADLIAQDPLEDRTSSRLLVLNRGDGSFTHDTFQNIGAYLNPGDCLVLNDTKVIPARLLGVKEDTGAAVEILLLKQVAEEMVDPSSHAEEEQIVTSASTGVADTNRFRNNLRNRCMWECLVRPGKKLRQGARIVFGKLPLEGAADIPKNLPPGGKVAPKGSDEGSHPDEVSLTAEIIDILPDGNRLVRFYYNGIWEEVLDALGEMPLPPYITHKLKDRDRYQTVYARAEGSAAAPTAGLHFTRELLASLQEKGIKTAYVTLHVGLGTFRPVKVENVLEHHMHSEWYEVTPETAALINETKAAGGRVICVGTTSCRTVESVASLDDLPPDEDADKMKNLPPGGKVAPKGPDEGSLMTPSTGDTSIFIFPGYHFKIMDGLITNFHLPESTLLMLVSAFAGKEHVMAAYAEAIRERYRFFSFGDAMLIL